MRFVEIFFIFIFLGLIAVLLKMDINGYISVCIYIYICNFIISSRYIALGVLLQLLWIFVQCIYARIYARCMFTWSVYILPHLHMKFSHNIFILSLPIMYHGREVCNCCGKKGIFELKISDSECWGNYLLSTGWK